MASTFENLASAMLVTAGSPRGKGRNVAAEAYIVNLSDGGLILTALLPEDSDAHRSLILSILDQADPAHPASIGSGLDSNRERILHPGEVAMLALRKPPLRNHTSLFRIRKEGQAGASFLRYSVSVKQNTWASSITRLGTQNPVGRLENALPHLLYVW